MSTPGIGKCALGTFGEGASSPDHNKIATDLMLANMNTNIFSFDVYHDSSQSINTTLPCVAWDVGCVSLKSVCDI